MRPEPAIPDKLYFKIGEVARLARVEPYVLRFWESEFPA
ncbi:MAG: MerR family transcriptional regulator, partial [Terriglobales bacterium]